MLSARRSNRPGRSAQGTARPGDLDTPVLFVSGILDIVWPVMKSDAGDDR